MSNNIILPLNIAPLRVSKEDSDGIVASSTIDYSNRKNSSEDAQDWLFPFTSSQNNLNVGIHLHWALPNVFNVMHSKTEESEPMFHAIPNRWLVVRMHRDMSDFQHVNPSIKPSLSQYNTAMWLLQSDAVHQYENEGIPIVGFDNKTDLELKDKRIGYKTVLKKEGTSFHYKPKNFTDLESLSSMSYYGMTFSSYYQNSKNILGFEDNLLDLYGTIGKDEPYIAEEVKKCIKCRVSYGIIGWHNGDDDYFNTILSQEIKSWGDTTPEVFQENLKALLLEKSKLTIPENNYLDKTITASNYQHVKTICSGVVSQLDFDLVDKLNQNTNYKTAKPDLRMSLGNTIVESMSAYLANPKKGVQGGIDPQLEKSTEMLFSAMQLGQLRRLNTKNGFGLAQLEEYIHEESFRHKSGGETWFIKDLKGDKDPSTNPAIRSGLLPISIAYHLAKLNQFQTQLDLATAEVHDAQNQLFLSWHKHIEAVNAISKTKISKSNSSRYVLSGLYNYLFPIMMETGQLAVDNNSNATAFRHYDFIVSQYIGGVKADALIQLPGIGKRLKENIKTLVSLLFSIQYGQELIHLVVTEKKTVNPSKEMINNWVFQLDKVLRFISSHMETGENQNIFKSIANNISDSNRRVAAFGSELDDLDDFDASTAISILGYKMEVEKGTYKYSDNDDYLNSASGIYYAQTIDFWAQSEDKLLDTAKDSLLEKPKKWVTGVNEASKILLDKTKGLPFIQDQYFQFNQNAAPLLAEFDKIQIEGWENFDGTSYTFENIEELFQGLDTLAFAQEEIIDTILDQWPIAQRTNLMHEILKESLHKISDRLTLLHTANDPFFMPHDPVLTLVEDVADEHQPILTPYQRNSNAAYTPARTFLDLLNGSIPENFKLTLQGDTDTDQTFLNDLNKVLEEISILANFRSEIADDKAYNEQCIHFYDNINAYQQRQKNHINPAPESTSEMLQQFAPNVKDELYEKAQDSLDGITGIMPFYTGIELIHKDAVNPFYPLFMIYEVDMLNEDLHAQNTFKDSALFDKFALTKKAELEDQTLYHSDLQYKTAPQLENEKVSFYNYIMLSRSPNISLLYQIEKYLHDYKAILDPKTVQKIIAIQQKIANKLFLSQRLSGFHENILQKLQTLQLPINMDYGRIPSGQIDQPVSSILQKNSRLWETYNQSWNANIPVLNTQASPYQPIRSGFAGFNKLYIVDSFGQFFSFSPNGEMTIAADLKHQTDIQLPKQTNQLPIQMPPRFVDPIRIKYNWISANKPIGGDYFEMESNSPEHSPLCGWMVPNHLDGSLAIYNNNGDPIEYWRTFEKSMGVYKLPGKQYPMNEVLRTLKSRIQELQSQMDKVESKGFLDQFITACESAQNLSHPTFTSQDRSLAVYMGRPMALVRIKLRLERKGKYAIQFTKTTPSGSSPLPDPLNPMDDKCIESDITEIYSPKHFQTPICDNVKIPVMLGNMPQFDDGLIGYFIESKGINGNGDFSLCQSPFITDAIEKDEEVKGILERHDSQKIALSLKDSASSEISLLLLIEPRSSIHIATGVLPIKKIDLPKEIYDQSINRLAMYFLAAPILTSYHPKDDVLPTRSIPIDNIHNFSWHWLEKSQPKKPGQIEAEPTVMQVKNEKRLNQNGMPADASPKAEPKIIDGWLKLDKEPPKVELITFNAKSYDSEEYSKQLSIKKGIPQEFDCQLTIAQDQISIRLDKDFTILLQLDKKLNLLGIEDSNWQPVKGANHMYQWVGNPQELNEQDAQFEIKKVKISTDSTMQLGHLDFGLLFYNINNTRLNGQSKLLPIKPIKISIG